ncbi:MAG: flagellar hook-basal body complex protein FliE [candidate division WS1 bacterium]|jgi:flagellar hook-basal body complex protein FliE|nr:flagellar hook-basal body complex protein FliE [candidate division WS1 bacterium]
MMRIDSGMIPIVMQPPTTAAVEPTGVGTSPAFGGAEGHEVSFGTLLREALQRVNETQREADVSVRQVATGEADDLHDAIIALEKADLTLRLTAQVTQRAVSAYQEIARMQL